MSPGSLVITKNRWGLKSRYVGLVIRKIENVDADDIWEVLWPCSLQEHCEEALQEITEFIGYR
jgi:hypothetical protein